MSRVGKQPVVIESGVKTSIKDGVVYVEGPKGKLQHKIARNINVSEQDGKLVVEVGAEGKQAHADFGTTRSIINNMVQGVSKGWTKKLEMIGVGFTANLQGNVLTLATGYSHDVKIDIPQSVTCKVQKTKIELESCDKHLVGQIAATIRKVCPPEPYLGKGIKYADETVRRKAGKTGV